MCYYVVVEFVDVVDDVVEYWVVMYGEWLCGGWYFVFVYGFGDCVVVLLL